MPSQWQLASRQECTRLARAARGGAAASSGGRLPRSRCAQHFRQRRREVVVRRSTPLVRATNWSGSQRLVDLQLEALGADAAAARRWPANRSSVQHVEGRRVARRRLRTLSRLEQLERAGDQRGDKARRAAQLAGDQLPRDGQHQARAPAARSPCRYSLLALAQVRRRGRQRADRRAIAFARTRLPVPRAAPSPARSGARPARARAASRSWATAASAFWRSAWACAARWPASAPRARRLADGSPRLGSAPADVRRSRSARGFAVQLRVRLAARSSARPSLPPPRLQPSARAVRRGSRSPFAASPLFDTRMLHHRGDEPSLPALPMTARPPPPRGQPCR